MIDHDIHNRTHNTSSIACSKSESCSPQNLWCGLLTGLWGARTAQQQLSRKAAAHHHRATNAYGDGITTPSVASWTEPLLCLQAHAVFFWGFHFFCVRQIFFRNNSACREACRVLSCFLDILHDRSRSTTQSNKFHFKYNMVFGFARTKLKGRFYQKEVNQC